MIPSQMLKGVLEGCILNIIAREETYGYEIAQKLYTYGFGDISEGTIYPILLRLSRNGCIMAAPRASGSGPPRKYYVLTAAGQAEARVFQENWRELRSAVNNLTGGCSYEQKESTGTLPAE